MGLRNGGLTNIGSDLQSHICHIAGVDAQCGDVLHECAQLYPRCAQLVQGVQVRLVPF